jgi:hypothetical protein
MNYPARALSFAAVAVRFPGQWWLCLAAVAVAVSLPVMAEPLLPGSTFVQCSADGNSSFHSTECTIGGGIGIPSYTFASAALSPIPFVSVQVSSPPTGFFGAGAGATSFYYFQVIGGNPGDIVPILIDFRLEAESTTESSALARMLVYTSGEGVVRSREVCIDPIGSCEDTSVSESLSLSAVSGYMLNSVTLYVQASAIATRISNESARAFADPYIYIDPRFPNASAYSIAVSPGVGNTPFAAPVPEPETLWLVGTVLVGIFLTRGCAGHRIRTSRQNIGTQG